MEYTKLLNSINEVFEIAKSLSDSDNKIVCSREFETAQRFHLSFSLRFHPNQSTFFCGINICLNLVELLKEYSKLEGSILKTDFTSNNKVMYPLIENKYLAIIKHLKDYNGNKDNYPEIAKLVDETGGRITSHVMHL